MENTTAAHGRHTRHGIPHDYTSLTPHLAVKPAREAIVFYQNVFNAAVLDVTPVGDVIGHAVLKLEHGCFTLSDPLEKYGLVAPTGDGTTSVSLALYLPDVDEVIDRAIAAGAHVREALTTFVSGDRFASIIDPFGVRWAIMTRVEDLSRQESAERVARWAATQT